MSYKSMRDFHHGSEACFVAAGNHNYTNSPYLFSFFF